MTTFYFVRHGHSKQEPGLFDCGLTELGFQEAAAAATYLQDKKISHIYTSPLRRAQETAQTIAAALNQRFITEPLLRERADSGDLLGERLEQFIKRQYQSCPEANLAAITHRQVIADFLLNTFMFAELALLNPDLAAAPSNTDIRRACSIAIIHYSGPTSPPLALALHSHLDVF